MGCWNQTCVVSNLHITYNQEVAIFLLVQNHHESVGFHYPDVLNKLCPFPFYGKYNDYGAAEDCHGLMLDQVVAAVKSQLVEFDLGENEYHDIAVKRDGFNIDVLFEADHEDRLFVDTIYGRKLKVTPVMIHKTVFDGIINDWTREHHYFSGYGTSDQKFHTREYKFADVVADLPAWIARASAEFKKDNESSTIRKFGLQFVLMKLYNRNDAEQNLAADWFRTLDSYYTPSALFDLADMLYDLLTTGSEEDALAVMTELLKGLWLNSFMAHTRKFWSRQSGLGSQNNEHAAYRVLINSMTRALDDELRESEEFDGEEYEE